MLCLLCAWMHDLMQYPYCDDAEYFVSWCHSRYRFVILIRWFWLKDISYWHPSLFLLTILCEFPWFPLVMVLCLYMDSMEQILMLWITLDKQHFTGVLCVVIFKLLNYFWKKEPRWMLLIYTGIRYVFSSLLSCCACVHTFSYLLLVHNQ